MPLSKWQDHFLLSPNGNGSSLDCWQQQDMPWSTNTTSYDHASTKATMSNTSALQAYLERVREQILFFSAKLSQYLTRRITAIALACDNSWKRQLNDRICIVGGLCKSNCSALMTCMPKITEQGEVKSENQGCSKHENQYSLDAILPEYAH